MLTLVSRLRSVWSRDGGAADRQLDGEPADQGPDASLFECSSCGAVYVATEKDTCSTCDADVEEVPSSLSEL